MSDTQATPKSDGVPPGRFARQAEYVIDGGSVEDATIVEPEANNESGPEVTGIQIKVPNEEIQLESIGVELKAEIKTAESASSEAHAAEAIEDLTGIEVPTTV